MKNFSNYKDYDKKENWKVGSKVVHGALGGEPITGSVSFPIFQTATFKFRGLGDSLGFDYTRCQNPTIEELERTMAILEEGTEGFALSSGMAAVMCAFSILKPEDHLILSDDIYGGTYEIAQTVLVDNKIETSFVDLSDIELFKKNIKPNTKMVFIESPTNPMMKVADIAEICKIAKEKNIIVAVDNTLLTPYYQKPLTLGADIVVHSGTKYLEGHNDTMAGFVVVKDEKIGQAMRSFLKYQGACLAPLNAWLTLRGIKTLEIRMQRHNENTMKVAKWLRNHPKVKKVYYVGFEDHPNYEVTKKQTTGFGGMLSFEVDSEETAKKVIDKVDMILFAGSLGGVESLITYPMIVTHHEVPQDVRERLGINEKLLRLSVGIEDPDDIIADLEQALK